MELGHRASEVSMADRGRFHSNMEVRVRDMRGIEQSGLINRFIKNAEGLPAAVVRLDGGLGEAEASLQDLNEWNPDTTTN